MTSWSKIDSMVSHFRRVVPFRIQAYRLRRHTILEASVRLIETGGCFGYTIDGVAAAAGIAKGVVYHHFDSKEDLLVKTARYLEAVLLLEIWRRRRSLAQKTCLNELASVADGLLRLEHFDQRLRTTRLLRMGCCVENSCGSGRAQGRLRRGIAEIMQKGQSRGDLRSDVSPSNLAQLFLTIVLSEPVRIAAAQESTCGQALAMDLFLGGTAGRR